MTRVPDCIGDLGEFVPQGGAVGDAREALRLAGRAHEQEMLYMAQAQVHATLAVVGALRDIGELIAYFAPQTPRLIHRVETGAVAGAPAAAPSPLTPVTVRHGGAT